MTEADLAAFDRASERRQRDADFAQAHPEYASRCIGCFMALKNDCARRREDVLLCMACALGDSN